MTNWSLFGLIVIILIIFSSIVGTAINSSAGEFVKIAIYFVTGILIIFLLYAIILMKFVFYEINTDSIVMRAPLYRKIINKTDIIEIYEIEKFPMLPNGLIRTPGFYFGPCDLEENGYIFLLSTDNKRTIIISTKKRKYGLTPENERMEDFLNYLSGNITLKQ
jgi:hypothetical protein